MNIYILEDNDQRIELFQNKLKDHLIYPYKDVSTQAIQALNDRVYDLIFLDHDLGGKVYVDSLEENTGYQLAKHLNESLNKDTKVIIHSYNTVGAQNIHDILKTQRKYIMPFSGEMFKRLGF